MSEHLAHSGTNLLSMLLAARDADIGESISNQQLRDEVFTLLVGGLVTTAAALQGSLILLAQLPETSQRVRAQHKSVHGSEPPWADRTEKAAAPHDR